MRLRVSVACLACDGESNHADEYAPVLSGLHAWAEPHARTCRDPSRLSSRWECPSCGAVGSDQADYASTIEHLHAWTAKHHHDCPAQAKRRQGSVVMR